MEQRQNDKARLPDGTSLPQDEKQPARQHFVPDEKVNKPTRFFSPLVRSFLFAFLILGIAAAVHFLTASPKAGEHKKGVYNAEDGSVYQVENYLKNELANPASFQAVHWSTVEKSGDLIGTVMYKVSVIYKALGNDGKPFMASKMFELDEQGNVWMVMDVDPFRSSPIQNGKK